jgi:hypothetical protein
VGEGVVDGLAVGDGTGEAGGLVVGCVDGVAGVVATQEIRTLGE